MHDQMFTVKYTQIAHVITRVCFWLFWRRKHTITTTTATTTTTTTTNKNKQTNAVTGTCRMAHNVRRERINFCICGVLATASTWRPTRVHRPNDINSVKRTGLTLLLRQSLLLACSWLCYGFADTSLARILSHSLLGSHGQQGEGEWRGLGGGSGWRWEDGCVAGLGGGGGGAEGGEHGAWVL